MADSDLEDSLSESASDDDQSEYDPGGGESSGDDSGSDLSESERTPATREKAPKPAARGGGGSGAAEPSGDDSGTHLDAKPPPAREKAPKPTARGGGGSGAAAGSATKKRRTPKTLKCKRALGQPSAQREYRAEVAARHRETWTPEQRKAKAAQSEANRPETFFCRYPDHYTVGRACLCASMCVRLNARLSSLPCALTGVRRGMVKPSKTKP